MERWELDNAFLRKQAVYLKTGKVEWPYVNGANAIEHTCESVARRVERYRKALEAIAALADVDADERSTIVREALSDAAELKPWETV